MVSADSALPRVPLSLRLPAHVVETVGEYAHSNRISKTDAFLHFLQKGMEAEESAVRADRLEEIESQLEQIKALLKRDHESSPAADTVRDSVFDAVAQAAEGFPAIKRAYLFGSFARGDFDAQSDVDVRVELDETAPFNLRDLAHFEKHIERATGRSVDVVSARQLKNRNLAAAIEKEKVLAYERES
ncbi:MULTISPECIES: nucleotidyltransferase family protein [Gordonibacter]|uniref:Nucleotidyltransferase domain-containing protein n=2 Tax=Gordonibacter TaxID=644652 RepID=A0ABT7DM80_9ACTN|nr:nucleotidyltransferase domain-containing protein [Gordonibacter sp. KGMB12511]MDJ1649681.1 nucleotidyltransferase domain-containing protein [Gordonibacter sp. KGMB12511]